MNENRRQGRFYALLLDPRLDTPLLVAVVCLSLFLAALILSPALRRALSHTQTRAAAPVTLAETPLPEEAAESFTLRLEPARAAWLPTLSGTASGWQFDGERYYYINEYGGLAAGLQRIDGRLFYFAPDGTMARALGVDVSYYNEDIDWRAVAAQGLDFAIIRLGGRGWGAGTLYEDTRAAQYLHNARAAGLRLGVYFYSTACTESEAAEEARTVLSALGGMTLELPVFIDVEESGEYPEGRADRLSRAERTRLADAFCRVIEDAGYEAGVYSGHYYYNSALYPDMLGDRTLWLANYSLSRNNRVPSFPGYTIWQFTDSGQVKGVAGYADLNVVF